jgi:hypothetical protein
METEGSDIRRIVAVCVLGAASLSPLYAQGVGSVTGSVRDTTGAPVTGAEVFLDTKSAITNAEGGFQLDGLRGGMYLILIRSVGYVPLRVPIEVRAGAVHYDFVLHRLVFVLPTLNVEVSREGIYGTVADSGLTPLRGAKVLVAGKRGGEVITDSAGRFAFPRANGGQYLVRATLPGYAEERVFVDLKERKGAEVGILLRHSAALTGRADELAVRDLGRRLVVNLPEDRLSAGQLIRYGTLNLCEVNMIASKVRFPRDSLTIIINGVSILERRSVNDLCSWRADEVELVEFGENLCRDASRTLVDLLQVWCWNYTGKERGVLKEKERRIKTQRQGSPFVVIWEKR